MWGTGKVGASREVWESRVECTGYIQGPLTQVFSRARTDICPVKIPAAWRSMCAGTKVLRRSVPAMGKAECLESDRQGEKHRLATYSQYDPQKGQSLGPVPSPQQGLAATVPHPQTVVRRKYVSFFFETGSQSGPHCLAPVM